MIPWMSSSIRMLIYIADMKTFFGIDNVVIPCFSGFSYYQQWTPLEVVHNGDSYSLI
jgi:hypothetical protein